MANVTQESIELARQLWSLYAEARGYIAQASVTWDDLIPVEREAWVQVAQFVEARGSTEPDAERDPIVRVNGKVTVYKKTLKPGEMPLIPMWDEPDHK